MTILTINTDRYLDSALHAAAAGTHSREAVMAISGTLSYSGGMAGWDAAGMDWADGYDSYVSQVFDGVQDMAMGCSDTSQVMTIAAGNYIQAEHVASLGTSLLTHPAFAPAVDEIRIATPPRASESVNPGLPPEGWHLVRELASLTWPNGEPDQLRAAAAAWSALAGELEHVRSSFITSVRSSVALLQAQDLKLLNERSFLMDSAATELAEAARNIAVSCTAYAVSVEEAHSAIRNLAQELMVEIAATVAIGAALTIFSGGLSALVGAGVAASRIHRFVSSVRTVLDGLAVAARSTQAAKVLISSAVRLRGLSGSGGLALKTLGSRLPAAVKHVPAPMTRVWPKVSKADELLGKGSDFVLDGPLSMLRGAGMSKVREVSFGKFAHDGDGFEVALHLLTFTALANTKSLKSITWGKAAYDRLEATKEVKGVIESGKIPWLVRKPKNYPGLPKTLPVIVPPRLRAAHPGPAPSRRTIVVKQLTTSRPDLPPVLDNPLLVQHQTGKSPSVQPGSLTPSAA